MRGKGVFSSAECLRPLRANRGQYSNQRLELSGTARLGRESELVEATAVGTTAWDVLYTLFPILKRRQLKE